MSLDDNLETPEAAPASQNANRPLDLKNDEGMELVWSKVEVSLDAVLKRSEALEVLLGFADTPALKGRLDVRLAKFKAFWSGLAEWDLDVAVPGIASSAAGA